jgi:hypothetical protein
MSTQRNLSLYHIGNELQNLFAQLYDHETGEVNMEVDAQLSALSETAEKKCLAVASFIKKMEAEKREIEFFKQEIAQRESAYNKEIGKLTNYLESNMTRCGIKEIKSPFFSIKIKNNPYSTDIIDESLIPAEFMKTREIVKTETKPDKNAIKEQVLKTGVQIPGASVQQKTKLEILVDKI